MNSHSLGSVDPARSRHAGRRSAVTVADGPVVGLADGSLRAPHAGWTAPAADGSIVALATGHGRVVAGTRSASGLVRAVDAADGTERWRFETATDLGDPQEETRFLLPFVAAAAATDRGFVVAARRYERVDGERRWSSVVYGLAPDGTERWRFEADASPISVSAHRGLIAVAYNRCPGDHRDGLVVVDDATGEVGFRWDPRDAADADDSGSESERRVGDVTLFDGGVAVAAHADYRGYLLRDGEARWSVDLGRPTAVDGETVYAYPNHVHATPSGAVFLTGNTYPEEGRQTDARHPAEHTAVGVAPDGTERWRAPTGGFATEVAASGDRLVVPSAQHFRDRDPAGHGCQLFDVTDGEIADRGAEGVVTAAALDGEVSFVEEPVVYHDEGDERGAYRLHHGRLV